MNWRAKFNKFVRKSLGSDPKSDRIAASNQGLVPQPQQVELSDPDTGEIIGVALGSASSSEEEFEPDNVISTQILPTSDPPPTVTREHLDCDHNSDPDFGRPSEDAQLRSTPLSEERLGSDHNADREYWPDPELDAFANLNHESPIVTDPEHRLKSRGLGDLEDQRGAQAPILKNNDGFVQSKREPDEEYWPDGSVEPSDLVIQIPNTIEGWFPEHEQKTTVDGEPTQISGFPIAVQGQLSTNTEDNFGEFFESDQVKPPRLFKPNEEKIRGLERGTNELTPDACKESGEIDLGGTTPGQLDKLAEKTDSNPKSPTSLKSTKSVANEAPDKTGAPAAKAEELIATSNNNGPMKPESIDQNQEQLDDHSKSGDVKKFSNGIKRPGKLDIQKVGEESSRANTLADGISSKELEDGSPNPNQLLAPANGIETQLEQIDFEVSDLDEAHSEPLEDSDGGGLSQVDQTSSSFAALLDDVAVDGDPSTAVDEIKLNETMPGQVDEFTDELVHNLTNPISSETDDVFESETSEKVEVPSTAPIEEIASTLSDDSSTEPEALGQDSQQRSGNNDRSVPDGTERPDKSAQEETLLEGSASGVFEGGSPDATQLLPPSTEIATQLELIDFEAFDLDEEEGDTLENGEENNFSRTDRRTQSLGSFSDEVEVDGNEGTDELVGNSSELDFQWNEKKSSSATSDDDDDDPSNEDENENDWLFEEWGKDPELQEELEFRPDANQFYDDALPWRISKLSALLVGQLPIANKRKQEEAFYDICEILKEFPAGSSHAAIARIVLRGASLEEILEMVALKRHWYECDELWLRRSPHLGPGWTIFLDTKNGRNLLTWSAAYKLLKYGPASVIADVMLPEWREAWIDLKISEELLISGEWFDLSTYIGAIANQYELSNCIDFDCRWPGSKSEFRIEDDYKVTLSEGSLSREENFSLRETLLNSRSGAWQSRALAPSVFDDGSFDEENS